LALGGQSGYVNVRLIVRAVGVMVFEKFIRYTGLAVGLKPSARGCEGRLRGLERIIFSKTITPRLPLRRPPAWPVEPAKAGFAEASPQLQSPGGRR